MTRKQYDSPKKNRLVGAIKATGSVAQAAEAEGIPVSSARKIWQKYRDTGSTSNRPRSGRPPKVTDRLRREIVRIARRNRRMPFKEIGNQVEPHLSAGTVRNHLALAGYHRRVARRVPYLTKSQRRKRYEWARKIRGFEWDRVIWSDESYIYLDDSRGRIYVTRRNDEIFQDDCLIPTFKQSSIRVMVWACIIQGRKGPLVVLDYPGGRGGGMNAKRYQEQVLEGKFLDFWNKMKLKRGNIIFQHDGAPSHTAKTTTKWLEKHGIPIFPHPPSSPDVNPIEHIWHILKEHIREQPHHPSSVAGLINAVDEAWRQIKVKDINHYIRRMDDVVEAVLKAKGGHTGF